MKKNYINLRHPQRIQKRHPLSPSLPKLKQKPKLPNFIQLSQQSIHTISSYITLQQIISLYTSIKFSHCCQQIKRSLLNYLIFTNRFYTKQEQKQFLALLIQNSLPKISIIKNNQSLDTIYAKSNKIYEITQSIKTDNSQTTSNAKNSQIQQSKYQQSIILTPFSYNHQNNNQKSRLNRFKQSIVYDVSRTFIKKTQKINKNAKILLEKYHNKYNKNIDNDNNNQPKIINENKDKDKNKYKQQRFAPTNQNHRRTSVQHTHKNLNKLSQKQDPVTEVLSNSLSANFLTVLYCSQQHLSQSSLDKKGTESRVSEQSMQELMQNYLKNVLINISQKYPTLGYIQGFNYIVKSMYMTGFTQQQSYLYLSYFIQTKHLGNIISNDMLGIRQLSYVLKVYIFNYIPKVYKHLLHSQLQPQIFCTSWFVTLFSEDLSYHVVNKLWHVFILEGWKIFIKFGIALICAYQQEILQKNSDDIFVYMRRIMEEFNQEIKRHSIAKEKREIEKEKNKRNNYYFKQYHNNLGKNQTCKKQQIVWKLMGSIEVNGSIVNQLCRQMDNLQKDSQIQIWRLQSSSSYKNLQSSRIHRTCSQRHHLLNHHTKNIFTTTKNYQHSYQYNSRQKLLSSSIGSCGSFQSKFTQQFCCDRTNFTDNAHGNQYELEKKKKKKNLSNSDTISPTVTGGYLFTLCHNVGPYID